MNDYPHDLKVDDVSAMISRLDRHRKSRVWFGPDSHLLNALCTAQEALERVCSELAVEGLDYSRPGCDEGCCPTRTSPSVQAR